MHVASKGMLSAMYVGRLCSALSLRPSFDNAQPVTICCREQGANMDDVLAASARLADAQTQRQVCFIISFVRLVLCILHIMPSNSLL